MCINDEHKKMKNNIKELERDLNAKIRFRYNRDKKNRPIFTKCQIFVNDICYFGSAKCHKNDLKAGLFSKKRGKLTAFNRALAVLTGDRKEDIYETGEAKYGKYLDFSGLRFRTIN